MVKPTYVGFAQRTRSEDTLWPYYRRMIRDDPSLAKKLSQFDIGSRLFHSEKWDIRPPVSRLHSEVCLGTNCSTFYEYYDGPAFPTGTTMARSRDFPLGLWSPWGNQIGGNLQGKSTMELLSYGPEAVADSSTDLTGGFDTLTFLGELAEGLPLVGGSLLKSKVPDGSSSFGSEFLTYQFGMKPLMSDFVKFGDTLLKHEKLLDKALRHSKKELRRKRTLYEGSTISSRSIPGSVLCTTAGTSSGYGASKVGVATEVTDTSTKVWYSGSLQYHIPQGDELLDNLKRLNAIWRFAPNWDTIWQLTPFSWLVDWFFNTGHLAGNLGQVTSNNLRQKYGYIMCETRKAVTTTNFHVSNSYVVTTKQRVPALPYFLGWKSDVQLNGTQLAILASLHFSRSARR